MSATRSALHMVVHLTNRDQVATLQQTVLTPGFEPGQQNISPNAAAALYSAPIHLEGPAPYTAPATTSTWFKGDFTKEFDKATFDRKKGGLFGISLFGGTTIHYFWVATFEYAADVTAPPPSGTLPREPIKTRRWADGIEAVYQGGAVGAAGGSNNSGHAGRGSSRVPWGIGIAMRHPSGTTNEWSHDLAEFRPGYQPQVSWERFYFRIPFAPDVPMYMWKGMNQNLDRGIRLQMLPSRQIIILHADPGETPMATIGPFTVDVWYKVDVIIRFGPLAAVPGPTLMVFINGALVATVTVPSTANMAQAGSYHRNSSLGCGATINPQNVACDFDDWISADEPTAITTAPPVFSPGLDWTSGSHVEAIRPVGTGTGHAWTGDWKVLVQSPALQSAGISASLTSAVANQQLAVATDYNEVVNQNPYVMSPPGLVTLTVAIVQNISAATTGKLGYAKNGGAAVLNNISQSTGNAYVPTLFSMAGGLTTPDPITSLELVHQHPNTAGNETLFQIMASGEVLGIFGMEDVYPGTTIPSAGFPRTSIHNAPYPRSPWAVSKTPPESPYIITSGTYVGTGNVAGGGVTLAFRAPVHWWWCRKVSGVTHSYGSRWWSSLYSSHKGSTSDAVAPDFMVQALQDPAYVPSTADDTQLASYLLRIAGADVDANQAGSTYQYIAVSDPGQRFMTNGVLKAISGNTDRVTPLPDATFAPDAMFLWSEALNSGVNGPYYKGPGHVTASVNAWGGTETANALVMNVAGQLTTKAALYALSAQAGQWGYSCWRKNDGSGDVGLPRVVQITSYVGDASASRSIGLPPCGRYPLFAYVQPHNAASVWRDPSHTSTNSFNSTGSNLTTGITGGGIDTIKIGSTLNTNGIIYDVFVLPGDTTGNADGWSGNGEFIPVEPTTPPGGPGTPYINPTPPEPGGPETPGGGGGTEPPPPIEPPPGPGSVACAPLSVVIANLALARIGVSQQIVDFNTDMTVEAIQARLHYNEAAAQTLRDVPWPFATRIRPLTAISGATLSANADWRWSYRQPSDCVFERRLVKTRNAAVDPTPPPFQLSSDTTGGLLFTNEADAVLEYTCHPTCVALNGDALFREALIWKLAAMLAPVLSRLDSVMANALAMYEKSIANARAVIKPGTPGLRAALPPVIDASAAAQAANTAVVNRALVRIGAQTITDLLNDQSREATAVRVLFEEELQSCLRDYPWAFATRYATLSHVAGDPQTPVNKDWIYAYRLPVATVMARRLVTDIGRRYEPAPPTFRLAQDSTGGLLYTDHGDPPVAPQTDPTVQLEYTARLDEAVQLGDVLFRDAFAWRLAATLAPSLAQINPERLEQHGRGTEDTRETAQRALQDRTAQLRKATTQEAWARYYQALAKARVADANEQQQVLPGPEAPWITDRI